MRKSRRLRNGPLGAAVLASMIALGSLATSRPSLAQGPDEGWVPVTIVYTSDVKGHIEPCG